MGRRSMARIVLKDQNSAQETGGLSQKGAKGARGVWKKIVLK